MTETPDARRGRWRHLLASTRRRLEVGGLFLVLVLCGAIAFAVVPAIADGEKLAGVSVPADDVPAIVAAALSCPSLNPPRLAAQLMAASGFSDGGEHGNIAGMDSAAWSTWRPSTAARLTDHSAVITALGHWTCEIVGQLRAAGLTGDLWTAAVAAQRAGVDAVVQAKGIPAAQKKQVDTVAAYARWYADQPEFLVAGTRIKNGTSAPGSPEAEVSVPADLMPYVLAAGRICPAITPVRVAAQLRVLSNFNVNLRSKDGRAGVAQFTTQLWDRYQSRQEASMWDPEEAIPAMGQAMCELNGQLGGLGGADPYVLALGAYQWGVNVIRQADGLPRTTVPQLADRVIGRLAEYEKDSRLNVPKASPSPSLPPKASPSAAAPTTTAPTAKATQEPIYRSGQTYRLVNLHAQAAVEVYGSDEPKVSGMQVNMLRISGGNNQIWRLVGVGEYVTITSVQYGMALAVENGSKDDGAKLVVETPDAGSPNQQWTMRDAGDGTVVIYNRNSGKVMDLAGDDWGPPFADGTWNGAKVQQWGLQDFAKDQRWTLLAP